MGTTTGDRAVDKMLRIRTAALINPSFATPLILREILTRTAMTNPRSSEQHTKTVQEPAYRSFASTSGGASGVAGRTPYREEFQRDHGPDLDERLDGTESGREF